MYCLRKGADYICPDANGNLSISTDPAKMRIFKTEKKAQNVLEHLPRHMKGGWTIVDIEKIEKAEDVPKETVQQVDSVISQALEEFLNNVNQVEATPEKNTASVKLEPEVEDVDLDRLLQNLSGISGQLGGVTAEDLNQQLSAVDREITDVEHYLEFNKFNAYWGYRFAMEIKELRQKRRAIKNKIRTLEILSKTCPGLVSGETFANFQTMANRVYTPRTNVVGDMK